MRRRPVAVPAEANGLAGGLLFEAPHGEPVCSNSAMTRPSRALSFFKSAMIFLRSNIAPLSLTVRTPGLARTVQKNRFGTAIGDRNALAVEWDEGSKAAIQKG